MLLDDGVDTGVGNMKTKFVGGERKIFPVNKLEKLKNISRYFL